MTDLIVQAIGADDTTLVVDSRLIAEVLGVQHGPWITNVVKKYQSEIEADFGQVHFENGYVNIPNGGKKETVYALLTEDQATCLMTYSKNTDQVRAAKRSLVKSFSKAKELLRKVEPVRRSLPETTLEKWGELIRDLNLSRSPIVMSAFEQRLAEELSGKSTQSDAPIILTVRANELGCDHSAIGTGSALGKYIVARGFQSLGKSQHGRYSVNTYEKSDLLDEAILDFCDGGQD